MTLPSSNGNVIVEAHASGTGLVDSTVGSMWLAESHAPCT